jgi:hypothetical protein
MSLFKRASAAAVGSVTNIFVEHPWRSRSFQIAAFIFAVGVAFWLKGLARGAPHGEAAESGGLTQPVPAYARVALSYMGGFLIGWAFRRFVRILFLISLALALLFAAVKLSGCDASGLRERISHQTGVAREKARQERDHLKKLLPSGTAAALGLFWGYWRRSRGMSVPAETPPPPAASAPPPKMT